MSVTYHKKAYRYSLCIVPETMNWSKFDVCFSYLKYILYKIFNNSEPSISLGSVSSLKNFYSYIQCTDICVLMGLSFSFIKLYFLFYYAMAADACLVCTSIISTWISYCKQNGEGLCYYCSLPHWMLHVKTENSSPW